MQHRDEIIIKKVISEINIGMEMLGETDLESFLKDEMLKRALGMTVKEDFVSLKNSLKSII